MLGSTMPPGFSAEGYHTARCVSLVELGTIFVYDKWQGQLRLTWEMPRDLRDYKKGFAPSPKQISKEYASSFYGRSWLKRHLTSWLGEQTVHDLDHKFDPYAIVGAPCMIKIEHRRNVTTEAWYEDISDIQPMPEDKVPPAFNEYRVLTFKNFDVDIFNKLPDFVTAKIMRSKEFPLLNVNPTKL